MIKIRNYKELFNGLDYFNNSHNENFIIRFKNYFKRFIQSVKLKNYNNKIYDEFSMIYYSTYGTFYNRLKMEKNSFTEFIFDPEMKFSIVKCMTCYRGNMYPIQEFLIKFDNISTYILFVIDLRYTSESKKVIELYDVLIPKNNEILKFAMNDFIKKEILDIMPIKINIDKGLLIK